MTFSTLRLTIDGPVATIALARPDKLNAIDSAMHADLRQALDRCADDEVIRERFPRVRTSRSIYCRLRRTPSTSARPSSGTTIR